MTTEPDNRAHNALDALSRQATADPPTRIPSLADLRRRAAQRRRRRNIARLAALPAVILAALGAWAITDTADQPTQLAVTSQPEAQPQDSEAPASDAEPDASAATAPEAELPGPFVWPAPPRGYATLDELVEQFAVEVLGWPADDIGIDGGGPEEAPQIAYIGDLASETPVRVIYVVAIPSAQGWGLVQVGERSLSIEESPDGGYVISFEHPPFATALSTVEVRYADGAIATDTTEGTDLALPPDRTPESILSVLVTHLDDSGTAITASGRQFTLPVEQVLAEIDARNYATIPDMHGLPLLEAIALLDERGIRLSDIQFDAADAEPGTVVDSKPSRGTRIHLLDQSVVLTIVDGGPSQSPEDAARDQIVPELASFPAGIRVRQYEDYFGPTRVETSEGIWLISRTDHNIDRLFAPGCGLGDLDNPDSVYGVDHICLAEYGEILLLDPDSGAILRAYPFPGYPPESLHVTDEGIYCFRTGDGALTGIMLCRIDRTTFESTAIVFPSYLESPDEVEIPSETLQGWTFVAPTEDGWEHLEHEDGETTITGWGGTAVLNTRDHEFLSIELDD